MGEFFLQFVYFWVFLSYSIEEAFFLKVELFFEPEFDFIGSFLCLGEVLFVLLLCLVDGLLDVVEFFFCSFGSWLDFKLWVFLFDDDLFLQEYLGW